MNVYYEYSASLSFESLLDGVRICTMYIIEGS